MKQKLLFAAVSSALGAMSFNALALSPTDLATPPVAPRVQVVYDTAGATASHNGIGAALLSICQANRSVYWVGATTGFGGNNWAVACDLASGGTVPNQRIIFRKTGQGGSGGGVVPVADQLTQIPGGNSLQQLNFTNAGGIVAVPSNCGSVAAITVGGFSANAYTCNTSVLEADAPAGGFSDVEPAVFGTTSAQNGRLAITASSQLLFGVPVSLGLRNALQDAQVARGELAATCSTTDRETEACMPNLSRPTITGLYTGGVSDWTTALGITNGTNDTVYIARRVPSSGTQQTAQLNLIGQPIAGVQLFVSGVTGVASNICDGSQPVYEGSGSGDVRACLTLHDQGGRWSVGVLSLDSAHPTATSNSWRWTKIDGAAPTLLAAAQGKYTYYAEQTCQRNTTALSGAAGTFFDNICRRAGNPTFLASVLNTPCYQPFELPAGERGGCYLGIPGTFTPPAAPITKATIRATPVNTTLKSPGGSPNNAQPALQVAPAY